MSRSVSLRKRGHRWYARYYDPERPRGNQRCERSLRTNRKDVAERKVVEKRKRFERGVWSPWTDTGGPESLSLPDAIERFLSHKEGSVQPRTLQTYRQQLETWADQCPAGLMLRDLAPRHIRPYTHATHRIRYDHLKLSAATRRKRWRHVKTFLRWAVDQKYIDRSPLEDMTKPKKDKRLPAWLSPEELDRLLEYIEWHGANVTDALGQTSDVKWLRDSIIVCLSCGLRRGEIASLRWEHVDLEQGRIHIRNSEDFRTKSGSERVVPAPGRALTVLRRRAAEHDGTPSGPVITDRRGLPIKPDRYTQAFKRMVRAAKLRDRERLSFHSLRHSCGAWLASQGVSQRIIQEVLGHASTQTTQVYSHVAASAVESEMQRVFGS